MRTFKQFFMERVYDVYAVPTDARNEEEPSLVGQADEPTLAKIARRTHKFDTSAEEKLNTFLTKIGFDTPPAYLQTFEAVLDKHGVDYERFADFFGKSKNKYNDFATFTGRGDMDFYNKVQDRIVGAEDSRSGRQTGFGVEDPYGFYNDLCKIQFAQGRVAVGECEFMLAVLTEGLKGQTGDIGTLKAGGKEYEIGTQNKVISKGIKDIVKNTVPVTRASKLTPGNIWNEKKPNLMWTSENMNEWVYFKEANSDAAFNGLEERCQRLAAEELQSRRVDFDTRRKIFSSCVLHKYITSHQDNCIIIFNGGSGGIYGGHGARSGAGRQARGADEFRQCRWLECGENSGRDAEWVFTNCVDQGWFNFSIDSSLLVRISYTV